ncbi:3-hydroxyacyl-CoA dehydrogenase NAD-binding domain-containing protein [Paracoccus marinus]|uniref:3-hydroxyacyl-CoA dehydrogenase NAD-binding domain-containing protein n=1 Tax=Paracoccus marinus TaxID=288426 RepID=UPI00103FE79B|nr:3-hydroxyacyl-CoA dehydrogenase NAD-binding domain-containing protein [Paracoccus marinus]GLS79736.1 hydroxyacyl-CoA dehydrogenase [Paracoccus marinus]
MRIDDDARIAVIGTGTIGASWAALFLAAGHDVAASDPAEGAEARLRAQVAANWGDLAALGVAKGPVESALERLTFHADPAEAARGAQAVQENAPERIEVKRDLLARLETTLAPDALILSSTSGLKPTAMQQDMTHPGRLVVGHPFNPPHLIPLVEIVGGERTSDDAILAAVAFYERLGKQPIRLNREITGHVANRLQAALWREAVFLAREGVASVADIDRALTGAVGIRWALMGPHLTFHLGGGAGGMEGFVKNLGPAVESWWADLGDATLDDETARVLVEGVAEETGGRDVEELARQRNAALMRLLALDRRV